MSPDRVSPGRASPGGGPLAAAIAGCVHGDTPPPIAAMRLLIEAEAPEAARAALARARDGCAPEATPRLEVLSELIEADPRAWGRVRAIVRAVDHAPPPAGDPIAHWAGLFERALAVSPEASVALYSLGRAELLDALTAETVDLLDRWRLLAPGRRVLDVGCGIGRLAAALASRVGWVTGLDIAAGMVAEARARCAHLPNLAFRQASGRGFDGVEDGGVDLVLMVDVFPYFLLSDAGLAAAQVAEAARVLRRGGDLVVLNASYRGDFAADLADLAAMGASAGLALRRADERPFEGWDAPAFRLVKP